MKRVSRRHFLNAGAATVALPWIIPGSVAIKRGHKLKWDPQAERFENDDPANAMLSRPMRSPWRLEA